MEKHIGNIIKKLSKQKNIKPQEIAYKWKKSTAQVYNLFKNDDPTASVVLELSIILGVSLNEIYGIDEKVIINEVKSSDTSINFNYDLYETLKHQIEVKDKQIEFLQNLLVKR